ncbi:hypothetical protein JHK82_014025 [Glycine max]|uniref:Uncharacterized protein n=1 Tax=Glycine max TaxID=3847 RepID=A0A0R0JAA6_SOYBN|nr:hypothetical protein JHK85_014398 [Glycine max]KAG5044645.1 hypothetical protein JHK86_014051 [Glycine max]KAG5147144.1 hypothetical protein JHK82_014025 [Glycine max]KAH1123590.1 hypothetical protein GYH30_013701 [Glycine max]KRH51462.1 hypothetical protein GLYMA_06G008100v4 [Glycine max]
MGLETGSLHSSSRLLQLRLSNRQKLHNTTLVINHARLEENTFEQDIVLSQVEEYLCPHLLAYFESHERRDTTCPLNKMHNVSMVLLPGTMFW